METQNNQNDLEACLRTFKRLAYKIDEMNTKLTHIIEDLRQVYMKSHFELPGQPDPFWQEYEKHDRPDADEGDNAYQ